MHANDSSIRGIPNCGQGRSFGAQSQHSEVPRIIKGLPPLPPGGSWHITSSINSFIQMGVGDGRWIAATGGTARYNGVPVMLRYDKRFENTCGGLKRSGIDNNSAQESGSLLPTSLNSWSHEVISTHYRLGRLHWHSFCLISYIFKLKNYRLEWKFTYSDNSPPFHRVPRV